MRIIELIIFSLATWRLASLLTQEDGPFFLLRRLRELVGIGHDSDGVVMSIPESFLGELLSCVWCSSIWIACGWVLFWWIAPQVALGIASIFAISTGAVIIEHCVRKDIYS